MNAPTWPQPPQRFRVSGVYAGYRIDCAEVNAESEREAKRAFRALYTHPRRVTTLRVDCMGYGVVETEGRAGNRASE